MRFQNLQNPERKIESNRAIIKHRHILVPNSCYFISLNTGSLQSFDDITLGLDIDGILQPRPEPYSSPTHIPSPKLLLTWKFCSFQISWQHAKIGDDSLIYRQYNLCTAYSKTSMQEWRLIPFVWRFEAAPWSLSRTTMASVTLIPHRSRSR